MIMNNFYVWFEVRDEVHFFPYEYLVGTIPFAGKWEDDLSLLDYLDTVIKTLL